ncbi:MAG: hypothetical protein WDO69_14895 [Pseudomonadota bacterium]
MKSRKPVGLVWLVLSVCAYGCGKDDPNAAKSMGEAGESAAGAPDSASGGADTGGRNAGGSNGKGGSGGNQTGAEAGDGGMTDMGGAAGFGGSDGSPEITGQRGPDLLGPMTDGQAPLVLATNRQPDVCVGYALSAVLADSSGNIYLQCQKSLTQYSSSFTRGWTVGFSADLAEYQTSAVSGTDLYVGGSIAQAALVARIDSNGNEVWRDTWSSSGSQSVRELALAPNGALYATGDSTGQAPGNPSSAAGGRWIAKYDPSNGTRLWLKQAGQYRVAQAAFFPIVTDVDSNLYVSGCLPNEPCLGNASLQVFDSSGNARPGISLTTAFAGMNFGLGDIHYSASDETLFMVTRASNPVTTTSPISVVSFGLDGTLKWYSYGELPRTAILDPVEGVEWSGHFDDLAPQFALSNDAIFVAGVYSNTYRNGSNPPPSTHPAYVARYDRKGHRVWFQEFSFNQGVSVSGGGGVALLPSGNLVVALDGPNHAGGPYLVQLKSADGTVVQ